MPGARKNSWRPKSQSCQGLAWPTACSNYVLRARHLGAGEDIWQNATRSQFSTSAISKQFWCTFGSLKKICWLHKKKKVFSAIHAHGEIHSTVYITYIITVHTAKPSVSAFYDLRFWNGLMSMIHIVSHSPEFPQWPWISWNAKATMKKIKVGRRDRSWCAGDVLTKKASRCMRFNVLLDAYSSKM